LILIDTSVLSLAFRRKNRDILDAPRVRTLRRLITEDLPCAIPGIVLQELLSGVRSAEDFQRLLNLMDAFPIVLADRQHHVRAANIANVCRHAGIAVSTVDSLIAAMAVETKSHLLTSDQDFERMAEHCGLQLLD
jgi:predicted nucleic acid-binding protein